MRLSSLVVWGALLGGALCGCGARTALTVEPCGDAGSRPCSNLCGEGTQVCTDGVWSACVVPPAERPCEDLCGEGVEVCADGAWGACAGGPRTGRRACVNECGEGVEMCADGVWGLCEVPPAVRPCATPCGDGVQTCEAGAWGRCSAMMPRPPTLFGVVRDFHDTHPDFEADEYGSDRGIVEATLGPDGVPVYAGRTPTTHGRMAFDQWYRDVPGINLRGALELTLSPSPADPSLFVYDDPEFFPIDGMLFGNEGREHNFHFTLEVLAEFVYLGGEIFRFRGDDDVFVFIDGHLVIDLGGVHGAEEATVELDAVAPELGLVLGERYPLRLFFAERHTSASTFTVETTLADPIVCD